MPSLFEAYGIADEPLAPEKKEPGPRGVLGFLNDTVIETANAAAGGVKSAIDFVKPGTGASDAIDQFIRHGEESQSDVVKAEKGKFRSEVEASQGVGDELSAVGRYVARNPILALSQGLGSFALPGGAVKAGGMVAKGFGAAEKGIELAGRAGGVIAGGAMSGGDAAGNAYDLVMQAPIEGLMQSEAAQNLAAQGADEATIRQTLATAAARDASILPALIGAGSGAFGAERLLAGGARAGGARGLAAAVGSEAAQEAVDEGTSTYMGQRAAGQFVPGIEPGKGVAAAAGMGAVLGGATGGGVHLITGGHEPQKVPEVGPLSRAANSSQVPPAAAAGMEAPAGAAPTQGAQPAPQEPQVDPIAERIKTLPAGDREEALAAYSLLSRDDIPKGVRQYNSRLLDDLLAKLDSKPAAESSDPAALLSQGIGTDPLQGAIAARRDEEAATANLDTWMARANPLPLQRAQEIQQAGTEQGHDLTVVPHGSGQGFTVIPSEWVTPAMRNQVATALPLATEPTGVLRADARGNVAPETGAQAIDTKQAKAAADAEAQRKRDLGLTPDVEAVQAGKTRAPLPDMQAGDVGVKSSGKPFATPAAAQKAQAKNGGEVVRVRGGWVVRPAQQQLEATDGGTGATGGLDSGAAGSGSSAAERSEPVADAVGRDAGGDAAVPAAEGSAVPDAGGEPAAAVGEATPPTSQASPPTLEAQPPKQATAPEGPRWQSADAPAREQMLLSAGWKAGSPGLEKMKAQAWEKMTQGQRTRLAKAMQAQPARETITPAEDTPVGKNEAGDALYERKDGSRYKMRNGKPDFGGDLAPVEEAAQNPPASAEPTVAAASAKPDATGEAEATNSSGMAAQGKAENPAPETPAEPAPNPADEELPTISEAQARKQLEWRYLGQRDGVKTHALFFFERPEDKGTGRSMGQANIEMFDGSSGWRINGEGDSIRELPAAKRAAEDRAIANLRDNGYVAKGAEAEKPATEKAQAPETIDADLTPKAPAIISDVGEKIGGARKDTATKGVARGGAKKEDDRPAWARRFQISQIVRAGGQINAPRDEGRWIIRDSRSTDYLGQPKQVGRDTFATKEEAEAFVPMAAVSQKHRPVPTSGGKYEIWRQVSDRKRVKVVDKEFATRDEAMAYMAQHAAEILEANTTFGEADLPLPPDRKRQGAERRKGDVKGEDFKDAFGFRGVEFGNWNNQDERQSLMNDAYDGLMDLAEVLGVPPKALGLNGDLALAFGARGQGLNSARAHYERNRAVINLTKENGAGSLAHEWFHGLDHYLGRQDGKAAAEWQVNEDGTRTLKINGAEDDMASGGFKARNSGVREEVRAAYTALVQAMFKKGATYVEDTAKADKFTASAREDLARELDSLRKELSAQTDEKYYKRNNKPATAEQLAEFDAIAKRMLDGEAQALETDWRSVETAQKRIANRWTNDTLEQVGAIYKAVRGRSGFDSQNQNGLMDRLRSYMKNYSARLKMLADAQAGAEKTKMVPTDFAMNAKELDQGRGTDYWTTPHEMAARAFQAYVEDKIAEGGGVSRFLNYAPENAGIITPWGVKRPYPAGAERKAINAAFDKFVGALETKETEQGVAMFRRTETADASAQASGRQKALQQFVDGITAKWANAPEVIVARDMQDERIPQAVRDADESQRSQGADAKVNGFHYQGKVYLVADALSSVDEALETLAHESLGHYGLRGTFGDGLKPILQQIVAMRKKDVLAKAKAYGLPVTAAEVRAELGKAATDAEVKRIIDLRLQYAAEEVLAEMAGSTPSLGFVKRAIAAIRSFLRDTLGLKMDLTDDEVIRNFIIPARQFVISGRAAGKGGNGVSFHRAYHGSPHEFDAFSTDKIGTGEGNQAFGWGLYFAENQQIAEGYKKNLSYRDIVRQFRDALPDDAGLDEALQAAKDGDLSKPMADVITALAADDWLGFDFPSQAITAAFKELDNFDASPALREAVQKYGGRLYQVEVPDGVVARMLQWDKTLDEQPQAVQEALRKLGFRSDASTGKFIYTRLSDMEGSERAASEALDAAGIPGIRYLDEPSRPGSPRKKGAPDTYNLVVFSDKNVQLTHKDGSPVTKAERAEFMEGAQGGDKPMFSRTAGTNPATAQPLSKQIMQAMNDTFSAPGKLDFWSKTVGTQYNLAQRSPLYKRVFDSVQDFLNDVSLYATEAADLAPKLLPKLETWRDIGKSPIRPEDNKAVSAPIFEGTLTWARDEKGRPAKLEDLRKAAEGMTAQDKAQRMLRAGAISENVLKMWQGLPIEQYEANVNTRYDSQMLRAGVVWTDDELKSQFKLTPEQVGLYKEFRAAVDKSLTHLAISDMVRFAGKDVSPEVRAEALASPDVDAAALMLRDALLEAAEADPKRNEVLIDTADKVIEKADRARDLMEHGYAPLSRFGHYTVDAVDENGDRVFFGMFETAREAALMARKMKGNFPKATITRGTVSEQEYKLFAGVSPETVELFGELLGLEGQGSDAASVAFQTYMKVAKANRSAMKRLIERKGIAGFSEDVGRVLAGFVYSNARQTSQNLHMGEMTQAASEIPKGQGELKDQATKLVEYVKNPQEEAQAFRGLLFAQFLGGSVASALVNMLQPVQMTFPYLSQFGGVKKAAANLTRAYGDVRKKTTGDAALDAAIKRGEEEGWISPQEVHQLQGQAGGKGVLRVGDGTVAGNTAAKAQNALSRLGLAWGKVFSAAEQLNRRATFIAAYRTAQEQGIADPIEFGKKAIAETQGIYSKANKPNWARGAFGGTLFTFKQYSIAYVELLHRMATQGGPQGKKSALLMLGMLFLFGGAGGLPFAEDLEDVIDGVMQRLGYNFSSKLAKKQFFENLLGKEFGRFAEHGISGLPGVPIDVSGRLGLGNLIPGTGLLVDKDDHTRDVLEFAGAGGDFVKRVFTGANKLASGDLMGAGKDVAPRAAANAAKALEMYATGVYKDDKGRKVIDVDGFDALSKGLGFQPTDVARVQEATGLQQRLIAGGKQAEARFADRWAKAVAEGDQDELRSVREDIRGWNAANPTSPVSINRSQIAQRVKALREDKASRIARTAPAEIRSQVRYALEKP